jgi:hypothetical protein
MMPMAIHERLNGKSLRKPSSRSGRSIPILKTGLIPFLSTDHRKLFIQDFGLSYFADQGRVKVLHFQCELIEYPVIPEG